MKTAVLAQPWGGNAQLAGRMRAGTYSSEGKSTVSCTLNVQTSLASHKVPQGAAEAGSHRGTETLRGLPYSPPNCTNCRDKSWLPSWGKGRPAPAVPDPPPTGPWQRSRCESTGEAWGETGPRGGRCCSQVSGHPGRGQSSPVPTQRTKRPHNSTAPSASLPAAPPQTALRAHPPAPLTAHAQRANERAATPPPAAYRAARGDDATPSPRLPREVTSGRWGQGRGRHFGWQGWARSGATAAVGGERVRPAGGRPPWPGSSTPRTGRAGTGGGWAGPRRCRCCRGSATGPSWCAIRAPSPATSCSRCPRAPASRTTSSTAWGRREAGGPAARALGPRVSDPPGLAVPPSPCRPGAGSWGSRVPGCASPRAAPISSRAAFQVVKLFCSGIKARFAAGATDRAEPVCLHLPSDDLIS